MKLVVDFEGNSNPCPKRSKNQSRRKLGDANWQTAVLTGLMVAGIVVPQFSATLKGIFALPNSAVQTTVTESVTGNIKFRLPVAKGVPTTSEYGWRTHPVTGQRRFHAGLDFGAAYGQPIYAAAPGIVTFAGNKGGYGNTVEVKHSDRESTLYGHASRILVSVGQKVTQGQVIAEVGSTGMSTGPHLHFEVHINGQHTNPRPFLGNQIAGR